MSARRHASTFGQGPDVLLLDAGTGARRLITEPALLEGVERVHVVLSHFHLDHVMGLAALAGLDWSARSGCLRLLAGLPADEVFERLVDPRSSPAPTWSARPASWTVTVSWVPSGSRSAFSLSIRARRSPSRSTAGSSTAPIPPTTPRTSSSRAARRSSCTSRSGPATRRTTLATRLRVKRAARGRGRRRAARARPHQP